MQIRKCPDQTERPGPGAAFHYRLGRNGARPLKVPIAREHQAHVASRSRPGSRPQSHDPAGVDPIVLRHRFEKLRPASVKDPLDEKEIASRFPGGPDALSSVAASGTDPKRQGNKTDEWAGD